MPAADALRLKTKARQAISLGSVAAARSLLEAPAMSADPEALFLLAETYDPQELAQWGVVGVAGDPGKAASYYRQASAAGYGGAPTEVGALNRGPSHAD